jgi:hypothetical protein
MANVKISQLPTGTATINAVVPATSADGTLTEKIKLGDIANLYIPTVVNLGSTTSTSINANSGDLFDLQANNNLTINSPFWSDTAVDGKMIRIRISWNASGRSITLGGKFVIAASNTSPLPNSATSGRMDILSAVYHEGRDKWDIISFIAGF